jgi:hypothetical protein
MRIDNRMSDPRVIPLTPAPLTGEAMIVWKSEKYSRQSSGGVV